MISVSKSRKITIKSSIHAKNRPIGFWLLSVALLVFSMILLGGITRLTGSGLSMVDWRPLMGILPPMNEGDWIELFEKYKLFPEYKLKNFGIELKEFKLIFWFEYAHRILGRLIGIFFIVPFLYFFLKKMLSNRNLVIFFGIFFLGFVQALLGWFMVQSGLQSEAEVSQYRLAAHFALAVIIYMVLLWNSFSMFYPLKPGFLNIIKSGPSVFFTICLIFIVMISGAFMAGTNAGLSYNTFPYMDGKIIPEGIFQMQPWSKNFFENIITIQFFHRIMAVSLVVLIFLLWLKNLKHVLSNFFSDYNLLFLAAIFQFCIGILTLLFVVPLPLGILHQFGSIVLITAGIFVLHNSTYKIYKLYDH
tara:strand:- start:1435 stop:2517 length:1083 start_codon:yes stop_codon:yes gene_type:complete